MLGWFSTPFVALVKLTRFIKLTVQEVKTTRLKGRKTLERTTEEAWAHNRLLEAKFIKDLYGN